ncbi:MAG TPA: twin-arginine translocase subunit TatC [Nitrospiria bacterium]
MTAPGEEAEWADEAKMPDEGKMPGEVKMPMTGHLAELRSRLLKVVWCILGASVVAYFFSDRLIALLKHPLAGDLYFFAPIEPFWVTLKVSFFAGLFLSFPFSLFQLWRFIAPGMLPGERRYALPFVILGSLFFILGLMFCYFIVFPFALNFLVTFGINQGLDSMLSIGRYMDFMLKFLLAFGLVFELPLTITLLARLGIVTAAGLSRYRHYAILGNALLAAILTPTGDIFNMMLMMGPLILFYELGILGARFFGRKPRVETTMEEAETGV